jgi:hypothetical protein
LKEVRPRCRIGVLAFVAGVRTATRAVHDAGGSEMQYMVSVIDEKANNGTQEEMDAVDVFNDKLIADGYWVFAGGLAAPSTATVIDNRGDQPIVTDGPFVETKELLAGFWIIQAPDLDVALKLATEGSKACNRKVEVRPFL